MKNPFERVSLRPGVGETVNTNILEPFTITLQGHLSAEALGEGELPLHHRRINTETLASIDNDTKETVTKDKIIPELWTNIPCLNDTLLVTYFQENIKYTTLNTSVLSTVVPVSSSLTGEGNTWSAITSTLVNNPYFYNNYSNTVEYRIPIIPLYSGRYEYTGRIRYEVYQSNEKDTENQPTSCPRTTPEAEGTPPVVEENTLWAGGYGANTILNVTNTIGTNIYNAGATSIYLHSPEISSSSSTSSTTTPFPSYCPFRTALEPFLPYFYPRIVEYILRYRQYQDRTTVDNTGGILLSFSTVQQQQQLSSSDFHYPSNNNPTNTSSSSCSSTSNSRSTITRNDASSSPHASLHTGNNTPHATSFHHRYDSDRLCAYVLTLMVSELALRGETNEVCMDLVEMALSLPSTQHVHRLQASVPIVTTGTMQERNSLQLHHHTSLQSGEHVHTHSLPVPTTTMNLSTQTSLAPPNLPIAGWFTSRSYLTKLLRRYIGDIASQRTAQALWGIPFPAYMYSIPFIINNNVSNEQNSNRNTNPSSSEETVIIHEEISPYPSLSPPSLPDLSTLGIPNSINNRSYEQSLAIRQRLLSALLEWSIGIETPSLRKDIMKSLFGNNTCSTGNSTVFGNDNTGYDPIKTTTVASSLAVCMPTDIIALEFLLGILRLGEWAYVSTTFLEELVYMIQVPSLPLASCYYPSSFGTTMDQNGGISLSSSSSLHSVSVSSTTTNLHGTVQRTWIQHLLNALYMPVTCPLPLTYYDTKNIILTEVHGIPMDGTITSSGPLFLNTPLVRTVSLDEKSMVTSSSLSLSLVPLAKLRGSQPVLRLRRAIISALTLSLLRKVRLTAVQTVTAVSRERELPSLEVGNTNDATNTSWIDNNNSVGTRNGSKSKEMSSSTKGNQDTELLPAIGMSSAAVQFLGTGPRSPDRHRGQLPSAVRRSILNILPIPHAPLIEGSAAGPDIIWQRVDSHGLPIVTKPGGTKPQSSETDMNSTGTESMTKESASSISKPTLRTNNKKDVEEPDSLSSSDPSGNSGHNSSSSGSGSENFTSSSQNPRNSSPPSPVSSTSSSGYASRYASPHSRLSGSNRNRNMTMLSTRPVPGSISPRPSDAAEAFARSRTAFHSSYSSSSPENTYDSTRKLILTDNVDSETYSSTIGPSTTQRIVPMTVYSINDPDVYGTSVNIPRIGSTGSLLTSDIGSHFGTESISTRRVGSPWNMHSDAKYSEPETDNCSATPQLNRSKGTTSTKAITSFTENLSPKGTLRDILVFIVSIVKEFSADAYGELPPEKESIPSPTVHNFTETGNINSGRGSVYSSLVNSPNPQTDNLTENSRPNSSCSSISTVTEVPTVNELFTVDNLSVRNKSVKHSTVVHDTPIEPVAMVSSPDNILSAVTIEKNNGSATMDDVLSTQSNTNLPLMQAATVSLPISSISGEDGSLHNYAKSNVLFSPVVPHPPLPLSNLSITLPSKTLSNHSLSSRSNGSSMQSISEATNNSPVVSPKAYRATPALGNLHSVNGRLVASSPSGPRSLGSTPIGEHDLTNHGNPVDKHIVSPSCESSTQSGSLSPSPLGSMVLPSLNKSISPSQGIEQSSKFDLTSLESQEGLMNTEIGNVSTAASVTVSLPSLSTYKSRISAFRSKFSPSINTTPLGSFLHNSSSDDDDNAMEPVKKDSLSLSSSSGLLPFSLSSVDKVPLTDTTAKNNGLRNRSSSMVSSISSLSSIFDKDKDDTMNDSMYQRTDTSLSALLSAFQQPSIGAIGPCRLVMAVGHILTRLSQLLCNEYDQILRQAILLAQADEGVARYLTLRILNSWPRSDSDKEKAMLQFIGSTISTWIGDIRRPGGSCMDIDSKRNNIHLPKCIPLFKRVSKRISICIKSPHHAVAYEAILLCLPKPIPGMAPAFHHRMLPSNHLSLSFGQRTIMEPSVLLCIVRALEENAGVNVHSISGGPPSGSFVSPNTTTVFVRSRQSTPSNPSEDTIALASLVASLSSSTNNQLSNVPTRTQKLSRSTVVPRTGSYSNSVDRKGINNTSESELSPSLKRHDSESSLDSLDSYGSAESENADTANGTNTTETLTSPPPLSILNNRFDNVEDADGEYSETSFSLLNNLNNKHITPRVRTGSNVPSTASTTVFSSVVDTATIPKRSTTVASSTNRSDAYSRIIDNIINTLKTEELESSITTRIPSMTRHLSLSSNSSMNFPLVKSLSFSAQNHETGTINDHQGTALRPAYNKHDHRKEERKALRILIGLWGLSEAINRVAEVRVTDTFVRPPSRSITNDFSTSFINATSSPSSIPTSPLRSSSGNGSDSNNNRFDYSRDNSFSPSFGSPSVYSRNGSSNLPSASSPVPSIVLPSINAYKGTGHWSSNIRGNSFVALQQLQAFVKEKYSIIPNDITNPEIVRTLRNIVERKRNKRRDNSTFLSVPIVPRTVEETNDGDTKTDPLVSGTVSLTTMMVRTPSPALLKASLVLESIEDKLPHPLTSITKGTSGDRNIIIMDGTTVLKVPKPNKSGSNLSNLVTNNCSDTSSPNIPSSPYDSPLDSPTSPNHTTHTPHLKNVSSNYTSNIISINRGVDVPNNFVHTYGNGTVPSTVNSGDTSGIYPSSFAGRRSTHTSPYSRNSHSIGRASPALAQVLGLSTINHTISSNIPVPSVVPITSYVATGSSYGSSPIPTHLTSRVPSFQTNNVVTSMSSSSMSASPVDNPPI